MLALEHLLICALPKLSLSNMKPQHLELFVVLATGDPLQRLSLEPGQQLTKLQKLLHLQLQSLLPRSLNQNPLQLLLDRERLHQPQLPMLHWQLQNPSRSFPLHLLQMGNA